MMDHDREVERALEARAEVLEELRHGKLSRRAMYKKIVMGAGVMAALSQMARSNKAYAGDSDDPVDTSGPGLEPFREAMPHPNLGIKEAATTLSPPPAREAQTSAGGTAETARPAHQAWDDHWENRGGKAYEITVQKVAASLHPQLPLQDMWGYDGMVPGPTFHSWHNQPILVRLRNLLPKMSEHRGYGCTEVSMHLHNAHAPSESDGFPDDYFPRLQDVRGLDAGGFRDHHYPNMYAGGADKVAEGLGTLWYHDHRHSFTSHNVYRGLAGFHLMFDEHDPGRPGSKFPIGKCDVPILMADRYFSRDGKSVFDQFNFDGVVGNRYVVNGKVQPFFRVEPRKYRLRILCGSVSRTFGVALMQSDSATALVNAKFVSDATIVATDGNLLPYAIPLRQVNPMASAQRLDVIVDFGKVLERNAKGKHVFLVNRWEQKDGREPVGYEGSGPDGIRFKNMDKPHLVMRFDIDVQFDKSHYEPDPLKPDTLLRPMAWDPKDAIGQLSESQILGAIGKTNPFPGVATVRSWEFDRTNGQWSVNGRLYDGSASATCRLGSGEIWVLQGKGSWVHPIHMHYEEHRTLYRNGRKPGPQHVSYGREDTVALGGGERGIIYRKFRDWKGKYVMHCHNTVHEDHAMMVRFDVTG